MSFETHFKRIYKKTDDDITPKVYDSAQKFFYDFGRQDATKETKKKYDDIIDFVKEHDMYESLQEWWGCN